MINDFWTPVKLSVEIATISLLIVSILGILAAKFMSKRQFRGKIMVETVFLLPLVLPPSVVGFLLIVVFGMNSPIGQAIDWLFDQSVMFTWWAAVIASTIVAFPLMYQSAKTGFEMIDEDIENASRVDGANDLQVFLHISMPLAFGSLITGGILSFARALGEFGATLMFAGNIPGKTQTIPTAIYMALDSGNMELAWLWVVTIMVISFCMLSFVFYLNQFKK
ncbi:molybdate ABC transporter permease subunit [Bacillus fonticola]|uniref:molybdate ABC transporter permease subunit n=1 Tax=Bacillus fonticola TaxID=2728853 RepID=UPI0014736303|nr:molybdate ABC transporter permease subunit [Bacillus fonticola]